MRKMKLIVAMDADSGIGKNGGLPWRIKKDMQYFASVTKKVDDPEKKNVVLMGRKCWESIPEAHRPLVGRLNVVLSRQMEEKNTDDLIIVSSLESALETLSKPQFASKIETIWNIGGAEIYELALQRNLVEEVHVTKIFKNFSADTHLKSLDFSKMERIETSENASENTRVFEENGIQFEFCKWKVVGC